MSTPIPTMDHIEAAAQFDIPARSGVPTNPDTTHNAHVGPMSDISPLLWLPCELLVHMASYLSSDDLFRLRLTCRRTETFLFATFSEEFFSHRRFMVTEWYVS